LPLVQVLIIAFYLLFYLLFIYGEKLRREIKSFMFHIQRPIMLSSASTFGMKIRNSLVEIDFIVLATLNKFKPWKQWVLSKA